MTAGISTWLDVGEFCPTCGSFELTYQSNDIATAARKFIDKMIETPSLLHIVEYLHDNEPSTIDDIVDTVPELKVSITTDEQKNKIVNQLLDLKIIDSTKFAETKKLSLSNITLRIIDEINKQKNKNKETNEKNVDQNNKNPFIPSPTVPDVIVL